MENNLKEHIDEIFPKKFQLPNRDGDKNFLIRDSFKNNEWLYELKLENDFPMTVSKDDNNSYIFIDPSGGPMIHIGESIINENTYISNIEYNENKKTFIIKIKIKYAL